VKYVSSSIYTVLGDDDYTEHDFLIKTVPGKRDPLNVASLRYNINVTNYVLCYYYYQGTHVYVQVRNSTNLPSQQLYKYSTSVRAFSNSGGIAIRVHCTHPRRLYYNITHDGLMKRTRVVFPPCSG